MRGVILLVPLTWGCVQDFYLADLCIDAQSGFDIEGVSVLQDAVAYPSNRDAVALQFDDTDFLPEESWRVTAVEVLVMVPTRIFDGWEGGEQLQVDVFDGEDPNVTEPWSVRRVVDPSTLSWEPITLPANSALAGAAGDFEQMGAWWNFDFRDIVPEAGMTSPDYIVGVSWGPGEPGLAVGYSNFNLDCGRNWTDYAVGSFELNAVTGSRDECSWPMMRVGVETRRVQEGGCDK